jgi:GDP-D-mannose dehydratase
MAIPESIGKTILITGINGYIASVLAQLLLTRGYSIRGTTRRISSSEPFLNGPWAPYKDRVKIYEVPDMVATGAFDEAIKGLYPALIWIRTL